MEKKNNNKKQERDYLLSLKKALFIGTLGVTTAISSACGNTKKISQENPFPNGESSIFLADNYDIDGLKFEGYEEAVEALEELIPFPKRLGTAKDFTKAVEVSIHLEVTSSFLWIVQW